MISIAGGTEPRWRRDGKELFYLAPDRKLMVVEVKLAQARSGSFEAGIPQVLFQTRAFRGAFVHYAVAGDGERFLVNRELAEATSAPATVVINWMAGAR